MAAKILHFADCHLGYVPRWLCELAEQRARDFPKTLERIVDMACDPANAIDLVVVAGDLFEVHDPDERVVAAARRQFERLADRHLPVVLVPGNHDGISYAASIYKRETFPGVTLVTRPQVEKVLQLSVRNETLHVYSVAHDLSSGVEPLETLQRTDEPGIHVAVLHASIEGSPEWDLVEKDLPLSREAIARSGMHYIALGHYHRYAQVEEGGVLAVYSGSTEGRNFGESGPRYVVIAEVGEDRVEVEPRQCHTRELRDLTLDLGDAAAASDAEIAERLLAQRGQNLLMRVRLTGPAEFVPDVDAIRARLEGVFFYVELNDETRLIDGALMKSLRDEKTIRGLYVRKMLERVEAADGAERATAERALKVGLNEFLQHRAG